MMAGGLKSKNFLIVATIIACTYFTAHSSEIQQPNFKYFGYQSGFSATLASIVDGKDTIYNKYDVLGDTTFLDRRWLKIRRCYSTNHAQLCKDQQQTTNYQFEQYTPFLSFQKRSTYSSFDGIAIDSTIAIFLPNDTSYFDDGGVTPVQVEYKSSCAYGGYSFVDCRITKSTRNGIIRTEVSTLKYGFVYASSSQLGSEKITLIIVSGYDLAAPLGISKKNGAQGAEKFDRMINGRKFVNQANKHSALMLKY